MAHMTCPKLTKTETKMTVKLNPSANFICLIVRHKSTTNQQQIHVHTTIKETYNNEQ